MLQSSVNILVKEADKLIQEAEKDENRLACEVQWLQLQDQSTVKGTRGNG